MIFGQDILLFPLPYDPSIYAEFVDHFKDAPKDRQQLFANIGASSPYLGHLLKTQADWLALHIDASAEDALLAARELVGETNVALRLAKARTSLILALCDLTHLRPLEWVTEHLTNFADFAVETALQAELRIAVDKGLLEGTSLNNGASAGMFVLAMGKMGAHELNYSSDIDLIFMFDDTRYPVDQVAEYRSVFVRITQKVFAILSKTTVDGYVFRTDLRLRPNPAVTVVCPAMSASETYYIREGRTWERAAFIKARVCAGDHTAGTGFLDRMQNFIWRRHLDFAALGEIEGLLEQSRAHKGLTGQVSIEGHNIKLGLGGIREIEFFAQAHQMIFGGRHAGLRHITTQGALRALAAQGRIDTHKSETLITALRQHRMIEHRIQMLRDTQTHTIPQNPEELDRLRALSGYETLSEFETAIITQLHITHQSTDTVTPTDITGPVPTPKQLERFDEWRKLPAFRAERSVEAFETQLPKIWSLAQAAPNPDEALDYFEYFISRLSSGVQLFSLFERRSDILAQVFHVTSLSKQLSETLASQVSVLDGLADTGPDAIGSDCATYETALRDRLPDDADFETVLIETRAWKSEEHFKITYAQLTQLVSTKRAEEAFSDLAQACLKICLKQSMSEAKRRYGEMDDGSVAVLAMGKLGSRQLTCSSDLDIIVIYDGDPDAQSSIKEMDIRSYYQKVARTLVTAISSSMSYGRLYEVDMRLRPSGRAGTVATSMDSFADYQKTKAWVWEHLALTRARVIGGDPKLSKKIESLRKQILARQNDHLKVMQEVSDMRQRLSALEPAKPNIWPLKKPLGGVLDIELLAQTYNLLGTGNDLRPIDQLRTALLEKQINQAQASQLIDALVFYSKIEHGKRLLGMKGFDAQTLSEAAVALFTKTSGIGSVSLIEQRIEKELAANSKLVDELMTKIH